MVSAPDRQECRANEAGSAIPTLPGWSPRYAEGHNDQHLNVPAQMHSAAQSVRQRGSRQGLRACGGAGSVPSPSPVSGGRARRLSATVSSARPWPPLPPDSPCTGSPCESPVCWTSRAILAGGCLFRFLREHSPEFPNQGVSILSLEDWQIRARTQISRG